MTNELMNQTNSHFNKKLGSEEYNSTVTIIDTINKLKNTYPSKLTNAYLATQIPTTTESCPNLEEYRVNYNGYSEAITQVFTQQNEINKTGSMQRAA